MLDSAVRERAGRIVAAAEHALEWDLLFTDRRLVHGGSS